MSYILDGFDNIDPDQINMDLADTNLDGNIDVVDVVNILNQILSGN